MTIPSTFPTDFTLTDDRYWYFYDDSQEKRLLTRYDVESDTVQTIISGVERFFGCSDIDPNWCAVQIDYKLFLLNLSEGKTRYIDLVTSSDERSVHSRWMPNSRMILYASQSSRGSRRSLIAYDPLTDTKHILSEMAFGSVQMDADINQVLVRLSGASNDILLVETLSRDSIPQVTASIRAAQPDIWIDSVYNAHWSSMCRCLVFLGNSTPETSPSLYAFSVDNQSLTQIAHFDNPTANVQIALAEDGEWVSYINNDAFALYIVPIDGNDSPHEIDFVDIDVYTVVVSPTKG